MATYKVLQDIEAEDKLFGPFTLKQFIFAAIAIAIAFIGFRIAITGAPAFVKAPLILTLLPFFAIFGFLAAPIGQDQPNDIWLFARLRFLFKPRLRIWNQDGISELVTITVPKKIEAVLTNGFSQDEVRSRLQALANTVDSRGWAVKNVNTNLYAQAGYLTAATSSDRLVDPSSLPQEVSSVDVLPSDDILDTANNSTAQHLDQLVKQSTSEHRQRARQQVTGTGAAQQTAPQDYWFMNKPATPSMTLPQDYATFSNQQVVAPGTDTKQVIDETDEEKALAERIVAEKHQSQSHVSDHMRVLQPLHDREGQVMPQPVPASQNSQQNTVNPAILELANNDDLNVATIARQAQKMNKPKDDGEVVISLH